MKKYSNKINELYDRKEVINLGGGDARIEKQQEAGEEITFNWLKYKKEDELPPMDKEVQFDRSKLKELDRENK